MPLSEEELRLLEQMERALVAEDPKLASTMRGTRARQKARRQMVLGSVGFVAGLGILFAGATRGTDVVGIVIGIAGFVVMLGASVLFITAWRGQRGAVDDTNAETADLPPNDLSSLRVIEGGKKPRRTRRPMPGRGQASRGPQGGSMMERFEARWRRRREQNGGF